MTPFKSSMSNGVIRDYHSACKSVKRKILKKKTAKTGHFLFAFLDLNGIHFFQGSLGTKTSAIYNKPEYNFDFQTQITLLKTESRVLTRRYNSHFIFSKKYSGFTHKTMNRDAFNNENWNGYTI